MWYTAVMTETTQYWSRTEIENARGMANTMPLDDKLRYYMQKVFKGSLCCDAGILGGSIMLNDEFIIYKTQKALPENYKKVTIPITDIEILTPSRSMLIFPAVKIKAKNNSEYKLMIFSRGKFLKILAGNRRYPQ